MKRLEWFLLISLGIGLGFTQPAAADDELDALRDSAAEEADSKPKSDRKAWSADEQDAHDHDHDHGHAHDHGHDHGHAHDHGAEGKEAKKEGSCECCEEKKDEHAGHDHSGHDHSGHDHSGHDHSGHDHSGHDHSGHDHSGHDHSGHEHAGHEHAGHEHAGHEHEEAPADEAPKKAPGSAGGCSLTPSAPGLPASALFLVLGGLGALRARGGVA